MELLVHCGDISIGRSIKTAILGLKKIIGHRIKKKAFIVVKKGVLGLKMLFLIFWGTFHFHLHLIRMKKSKNGLANQRVQYERTPVTLILQTSLSLSLSLFLFLFLFLSLSLSHTHTLSDPPL